MWRARSGDTEETAWLQPVRDLAARLGFARLYGALLTARPAQWYTECHHDGVQFEQVVSDWNDKVIVPNLLRERDRAVRRKATRKNCRGLETLRTPQFKRQTLDFTGASQGLQGVSQDTSMAPMSVEARKSGFFSRIWGSVTGGKRRRDTGMKARINIKDPLCRLSPPILEEQECSPHGSDALGAGEGIISCPAQPLSLEAPRIRESIVRRVDSAPATSSCPTSTEMSSPPIVDCASLEAVQQDKQQSAPAASSEAALPPDPIAPPAVAEDTSVEVVNAHNIVGSEAVIIADDQGEREGGIALRRNLIGRRNVADDMASVSVGEHGVETVPENSPSGSLDLRAEESMDVVLQPQHWLTPGFGCACRGAVCRT